MGRNKRKNGRRKEEENALQSRAYVCHQCRATKMSDNSAVLLLSVCEQYSCVQGRLAFLCNLHGLREVMACKGRNKWNTAKAQTALRLAKIAQGKYIRENVQRSITDNDHILKIAQLTEMVLLLQWLQDQTASLDLRRDLIHLQVMSDQEAEEIAEAVSKLAIAA